jgi:hypothetical protein
MAADSSSSGSPWRYIPLSPNEGARTMRVVVRKFWKMLEVSATQQMHASEWAENPIYFWSSWPVLLLVADIFLALALKKVWVLYGSMIVLFSQILWIVFKWIVFIVDDPDLWKAVAMIKGLCHVFLSESENIAKGDASRFLMVGCFAYTAPTGIGYAKAVIRYRMHEMNYAALRELEQAKRFEPTEAFKAEMSMLRKRGTAAMVAASRRLANMEERRKMAMDVEEVAKT